MTLLTYFLDLFLKEKQMNSSRIIVSAAGCLLLLIGIGMGFFFVFQYMVPIWGYLESGAFLCIASLLGGILLLLISRPKQQDNPVSKLVDTTTDSLKNLHIEEMTLLHGLCRPNMPAINAYSDKIPRALRTAT
jgi:hypothetical protein